MQCIIVISLLFVINMIFSTIEIQIIRCTYGLGEMKLKPNISILILLKVSQSQIIHIQNVSV